MTTSLRDLQERGFGADAAPRCVVDRAALTALCSASFGIYARGRLGRQKLRVGPVPVAVLLAADPDLVVAAVTRVLILIFPADSAPPATTIAKRYYLRLFFLDPVLRRRRARHGYRARPNFPFNSPERAPHFLYAAVAFIFILFRRTLPRQPVAGERRARRRRAWHRWPREFGIGIGTLVMALNVILLASYTFGAATRCAISSAARSTAFSCARGGQAPLPAVAGCQRPESSPHALAGAPSSQSH